MVRVKQLIGHWKKWSGRGLRGSARTSLERWLLLVLAAVVPVALVHQLLFSAYLPRRARLTREIRARELLLQRNARLEREAGAIRLEFEALRSSVAEGEVLPAGATAVLGALEDAARGRVKLESVSTIQAPRRQRRDTKGSRELPVTMKFSGALEHVADFLLVVARELGGEIDAVVFSPGVGQSGALECRATYLFPADAHE
ncbi:MAG: hypothetical protein ACE5G2_06200 [Candidatus Krumholzibacteriia bacterium]